MSQHRLDICEGFSNIQQAINELSRTIETSLILDEEYPENHCILLIDYMGLENKSFSIIIIGDWYSYLSSQSNATHKCFSLFWRILLGLFVAKVQEGHHPKC